MASKADPTRQTAAPISPANAVDITHVTAEPASVARQHACKQQDKPMPMHDQAHSTRGSPAARCALQAEAANDATAHPHAVHGQQQGAAGTACTASGKGSQACSGSTSKRQRAGKKLVFQQMQLASASVDDKGQAAQAKVHHARALTTVIESPEAHQQVAGGPVVPVAANDISLGTNLMPCTDLCKLAKPSLLQQSLHGGGQHGSDCPVAANKPSQHAEQAQQAQHLMCGSAGATMLQQGQQTEQLQEQTSTASPSGSLSGQGEGNSQTGSGSQEQWEAAVSKLHDLAAKCSQDQASQSSPPHVHLTQQQPSQQQESHEAAVHSLHERASQQYASQQQASQQQGSQAPASAHQAMHQQAAQRHASQGHSQEHTSQGPALAQQQRLRQGTEQQQEHQQHALDQQAAQAPAAHHNCVRQAVLQQQIPKQHAHQGTAPQESARQPVSQPQGIKLQQQLAQQQQAGSRRLSSLCTQDLSAAQHADKCSNVIAGRAQHDTELQQPQHIQGRPCDARRAAVLAPAAQKGCQHGPSAQRGCQHSPSAAEPDAIAMLRKLLVPNTRHRHRVAAHTTKVPVAVAGSSADAERPAVAVAAQATVATIPPTAGNSCNLMKKDAALVSADPGSPAMAAPAIVPVIHVQGTAGKEAQQHAAHAASSNAVGNAPKHSALAQAGIGRLQKAPSAKSRLCRTAPVEQKQQEQRPEALPQRQPGLQPHLQLQQPQGTGVCQGKKRRRAEEMPAESSAQREGLSSQPDGKRLCTKSGHTGDGAGHSQLPSTQGDVAAWQTGLKTVVATLHTNLPRCACSMAKVSQ